MKESIVKILLLIIFFAFIEAWVGIKNLAMYTIGMFYLFGTIPMIIAIIILAFFLYGLYWIINQAGNSILEKHIKN